MLRHTLPHRCIRLARVLGGGEHPPEQASGCQPVIIRPFAVASASSGSLGKGVAKTSSAGRAQPLKMGVCSPGYATGDGRLPLQRPAILSGCLAVAVWSCAKGSILSTIRAARSSVCTASRAAAGVGGYIRWSDVSEVRKLPEVIYRLLETFRLSSGASSQGPLLWQSRSTPNGTSYRRVR